MNDGIALIVGLGNPGPDYAATRHNAGEWLVRELASRQATELRPEAKFFGEIAKVRLAGRDRWLLVPATFMNRSGRAVSALARFYRIEPEAILVAHDELDFPAGVCRLKRGGGHGGHNGLRDIISAIGGAGFARLRIGIGHPGEARLVHDYVLKAPSLVDRQRIGGAIDAAIAVLPEVLREDWTAAMNRLHAFDASTGQEN